MTRTVLLHCPISAEIRTVDSQSDLRNFVIVIITVVKTFVKNVMRVRICGNLRITSVAIVFRL